MRILLIFILLFCLNVSLLSQQRFIHLNSNDNISVETELNRRNINIHSAIKPYLKSSLDKYYNTDSVLYNPHRDSAILAGMKHPWFWKKLRKEDFIIVDTGDFFLKINPLINLSFGENSMTDSSLSINTRGIMVEGDIGSKLSFFSSFYENQAYLPDYVREYSSEHGVIPGRGRRRAFKGWGYDYSWASGYLSYSPSKWLNFNLGHYKNFIGEGYRSLLLSDFGTRYPFFKTTINTKNIQYTSMYTAFQEISAYDNRLLAYQRKHGTFNYLNFCIGKRLQVGLFEGIIWKTTDSSSNNNINANFYNPIILVRPLQFSLDDENNILLGLNSKFKISRQFILYGQFIIDDLHKSSNYPSDKTGYQIGIKAYNPGNIKNLFLLTEYNSVKPYTYSSKYEGQHYTEANQPLAHPLESNFKEFVFMGRYRFKDFFIKIKYTNAVTGLDTASTHYGSDIFISDEYYTASDIPLSEIGRGLETNITHRILEFGYLLNPATNLQFYFRLNNRKLKNTLSEHESNVFLFGIKTSLFNFYSDY